MIKFFRFKRHNMINQHKTKKSASPARPNGSSGRAGRYLIYAIGEIILVVIGILIALQINNWNEEKKDRQLEDNLLEKIASNVKDDIDQYNKILTAQDGYRQQIDSFLIIIRNPFKYDTSDLDEYYKALWFFERFTPNEGAMTNLISSGKINIIENESLLEEIQTYYKTIEEQTASVDEAMASYSRNQIGPFMMNFDFMDSNSINSEFRKRKTLMEYHQNPAIENLVLARLQLMNTQRIYYRRQIENAENLIRNINEEI